MNQKRYDPSRIFNETAIFLLREVVEKWLGRIDPAERVKIMPKILTLLARRENRPFIRF